MCFCVVSVSVTVERNCDWHRKLYGQVECVTEVRYRNSGGDTAILGFGKYFGLLVPLKPCYTYHP
jgi:hypothetical protein